MSTEQQKITCSFAGVDSWGRNVFKGDNGLFYKTTELTPRRGFNNLSREDQLQFFRDLHTCNGEFEGEPGWPVDLNRFTMA